MNTISILLAVLISSMLPMEMNVKQEKEAIIFQKNIETKTKEVVNTYSEEINLDAELQEHVFHVAEEYNLSPYLIFAMIETESTFKADAVNYDGTCLGLMQVSIVWHKDRMERLECDDLFDPYQNILVGCDYISELIEQAGSIEYALMLYNMHHDDATKMYESGKISKYAKKITKRTEEIEQLYKN